MTAASLKWKVVEQKGTVALFLQSLSVRVSAYADELDTDVKVRAFEV